MARRNLQHGFHFIEIGLIVVVLGVIAFVAYRVIQANGEVDVASTSRSNVVDTAAPVVKNTSDLDTLEKQLDATNIDSTAATDLQTASNF